MGARVARLVVIGGGAAGMSAASAARRVDPGLEVVVCEAGGFAAYGMCGIPYFLGGTVPQAEDLFAYPPSTFREKRGIYPGGSPLHVRLVHTRDGRLLGGQLAGREGAAKRVDVLATALHAGFTVADLAGLDLSYAPPFAPVYDPVLVAAIKASRELAALTAGGSP